MTSKSMTFRFPAPLAQAIDAQSRATGRDRTTIVTEALAQMFGLSLPSKPPITLETLQQQVDNLEQTRHAFRSSLRTYKQAPPAVMS
ncbi:MAG: hypothetical protein HC881_03315 [Leptolyngbyaceae cyanobacterium SL_7_1]|nr:hypothetical protein [Leptolyngbyaceae cyanobacterium SL_7_1]